MQVSKSRPRWRCEAPCLHRLQWNDSTESWVWGGRASYFESNFNWESYHFTRFFEEALSVAQQIRSQRKEMGSSYQSQHAQNGREVSYASANRFQVRPNTWRAFLQHVFCLDQVPLQRCTLRWLRQAFGKHGHDGCCSEYFFSLLLGDGKDSLEVPRKLDRSRPSYRTWLMHTLLWQHEDCNWSWPLLKLITTNPLKFCFWQS